MSDPEIGIELKRLLQFRLGFRIAAGVVQKHSFESARDQKDRIEFARTRYLDDRLLVSAQVGQKMRISEMGNRRVVIESDGTLRLCFGGDPIPIKPDEAERERSMRLRQRIIE